MPLYRSRFGSKTWKDTISDWAIRTYKLNHLSCFSKRVTFINTEDNLKIISCVWMWARFSGAFLDHENTADTTINWYSTNSSIPPQNIHRWNRIFSHQSQDKQLVQTKCKMTVASGDCRLLIESSSLKYKNRTRAENNIEIPLKECFCAIPNAHLSLTRRTF